MTAILYAQRIVAALVARWPWLAGRRAEDIGGNVATAIYLGGADRALAATEAIELRRSVHREGIEMLVLTDDEAAEMVRLIASCGEERAA